MKHKLSAIIFDNQCNIINTGYNRWLLIGHQSKIPYQTSIHAEMDAILGCSRQELWGSSILVWRHNGNLAKPCSHCQKLIDISGIRNVYYSQNGDVIKL